MKIKDEVEEIFDNWGYGSNSDKEVCKRLICELIEKKTKPYKKALKIIKDAFPIDAIQDQLGEDYHKIEKTFGKI